MTTRNRAEHLRRKLAQQVPESALPLRCHTSVDGALMT
jgi:hypothetical protein